MTLQRISTLVGSAALAVILLAPPAARAGVPAGFVDASTFGYNAADATAALQGAINTGQNVYVPDMGTPWIVTPITLTHSNQTIQFQSGTVVEAKQGDSAYYPNDASLFSASGISHVNLIGYGATLQMHKTDYLSAPYTPGEWRMGISLGTVSDFQIEGLTIKDTGGDGIYVGASAGTYCDNVTIKDVTLDNNYRQGISVISAKNLSIDNAVILNTSGTAPQAGIDFEPNTPDQVLQNITVKNSIINANGSHGIFFATGNMADPGAAQVAISNVTFDGNVGSGIRMELPQPGVTIKNSLFVANNDNGVAGATPTLDLVLNGPPPTSIDHSAFWANADGATSGWVTVGSGSYTGVQPLFYSTDPSSPWFMYLDPAVSSLIATGTDNGGYMGARPVYGTSVPEPATLGLFALATLAWLGKRRPKDAR